MDGPYYQTWRPTKCSECLIFHPSTQLEMDLRKTLQTFFLTFAAFGLGVGGALAADAYPSGPVTIISGFSAGGPTDSAARVAAKLLEDKLKQPVIVDTKSGANGLISIQALKRAKPDGYTLLAVTAGMATVTPAVKKAVGYDPLKDFTPIAIVGEFPYVLVSRTTFPANDVAGLMDYAKKNPGTVTYGSAGSGSSNHLAGEWFSKMGGVTLSHIPYKGDSPGVSDLIAGRLDVYFMTPSVAMPHVQAGKMKVLGVASLAPTTLVPGVKALISSAVPGFEMGSWIGLVGPPGLPREIVQQINQALNDAFKTPQSRAMLAAQGQDPVPATPEQFASRMRTELKQWQAVANDAKIVLE